MTLQFFLNQWTSSRRPDAIDVATSHRSFASSFYPWRVSRHGRRRGRVPHLSSTRLKARGYAVEVRGTVDPQLHDRDRLPRRHRLDRRRSVVKGERNYASDVKEYGGDVDHFSRPVGGCGKNLHVYYPKALVYELSDPARREWVAPRPMPERGPCHRLPARPPREHGNVWVDASTPSISGAVWQTFGLNHRPSSRVPVETDRA